MRHQKYKNRFLPAHCSEADFNSLRSSYKFNDNWLAEAKETFKRVNKNVINFIDSWSPPADPAKEEKLNKAVVEEINRLIEKIKLECTNVTATLDSTFKKLYSLTDINPGVFKFAAAVDNSY